MSLAIKPARTRENLQHIAALFQEYAASLGVDLAFQNFQAELANLPGAYAPPAGELLLATLDHGDPAGCVGVRPLPVQGRCEMKRLYVRPAGRGTGAGRALAVAAIDFAASSGYQEMVLDTLPALTGAITLYRSLGFTETLPYNSNPLPGVLFFRKDLRISLASAQ